MEELELLLAVRARPDEDEPRLAYARWLEKHGHPERAELIRLQCGPGDPEREWQLLLEHGASWRAGLTLDGYFAPFERGFPSPLSSFCVIFHRDAAAMAARILEIAAAPQLLWCRSLFLGFDCDLEDAPAEALATSAWAGYVQQLELNEIHLSPHSLGQLARLPSLRRLLVAGGYSRDWCGTEYRFPTLRAAELAALEGTGLEQIELRHQELEEGAVARLFRCNAALRTVRTDRETYNR